MPCVAFRGVVGHKNAVGHHKNERYGLKNVCAHQKRTIRFLKNVCAQKKDEPYGALNTNKRHANDMLKKQQKQTLSTTLPRLSQTGEGFFLRIDLVDKPTK